MEEELNDCSFYKIVNINGDVELSYVGSTANWKERTRAHRKLWCRDSTGRFLPVMSQKRHIATVVLV